MAFSHMIFRFERQKGKQRDLRGKQRERGGDLKIRVLLFPVIVSRDEETKLVMY